MESSFHDNLCSLRDVLRMLHSEVAAEDACKKKKSELSSYAQSLISTNETIAEMHEKLQPERKREFFLIAKEVREEVMRQKRAEEKICTICGRDCLEAAGERDPSESSECTSGEEEGDAAAFGGEEDRGRSTAHGEWANASYREGEREYSVVVEPAQIDRERRAAAVEGVYTRIQALDETARFVESIVDLQGDGVADALRALNEEEGRSRFTLQDLEEILARRKRRVFLTRCIVVLAILTVLITLLLVNAVLPRF